MPCPNKTKYIHINLNKESTFDKHKVTERKNRVFICLYLQIYVHIVVSNTLDYIPNTML